ncbi:MAG: transposase [Gammaproteobacteria bacterium]|nr:transposase [Gammaproteobacteria bacterium]
MADDEVTISMSEMSEMFPNAESAREFLENHRWRGHVHCPTCSNNRITARKGKRLGYYRCRRCKDEFTVRTGTIFERSHVPLHKWLYAIYFFATDRKGISSTQLSKELGVTQATAWFMLDRLRKACEVQPQLVGEAG